MGRSPCEKSHTNNGAWTKEEDDRLTAYIRAHGEGCWRSLPKAAGLLRCGKSCRLRWINYLRPDLKRGNFTEEEDDLIVKLHSHLGNKWSLISGRLKGRTDNEIKIYWNTRIRRKLLSRAIDPTTHKPISEPVSDSKDQVTKTIYFSSNTKSKEEQKINRVGILIKDENSHVQERCPDLNLELRISLPCQIQEPLKTGGRNNGGTLCFVCSLGIQNSKDCSCFNGLKSGLLDYRSLKMNGEMKV